MSNSELMYSDRYGIYIPQQFAEDFYPHGKDLWDGITDEQWEDLKKGPDCEFYWDSWEMVLDNATHTDKNGVEWRLYHDGDCWAINDKIVFDDMGNFYDAEENPYATPETIEWNIENNEGFEDKLLESEMVTLLDGLYGCLGDQITYNDGGQDKASRWAAENYEDLEFCLEHNPGWYFNPDKLGRWDSASPSWQQREYSCDGDLFDGIVVGTIRNLGEIEIQAENGECYYHSGFSSDYFRILARIA